VKVTVVTDFRYRRGDINLDTSSRRQENGCSLFLYVVQLKNAKDILVTVKQLNVLEHNFWRLLLTFSRDHVLPVEWSDCGLWWQASLLSIPRG
jgi:hypothetical protein